MKGKRLTVEQKKQLVRDGIPSEDLHLYLLLKTEQVQEENSKKSLSKSGKKLTQLRVINVETGKERVVIVRQ